MPPAIPDDHANYHGLPVFFIHTHLLPSAIAPSILAGAVVAVELDIHRFRRFYDSTAEIASVDAFFHYWPRFLRARGMPATFRWAFTIEGAASIPNISKNLEDFTRKGVRVIQPYHWRNAPFFEEGRLTLLGRDLLARMRALNLILDVSHMSGRALMDVLDAFDGRIIASHVVLREQLSLGIARSNSLSIREIEALAGRSALLGVPFINDLLATNGPDSRGEYSVTMDDLLRQIQALVEIAGPTLVALGPDFCDFEGYSSRLKIHLGIPAALDTTMGLMALQERLRCVCNSAADMDGLLFLNAFRFLHADLLQSHDTAEQEGNVHDEREACFSSPPWTFDSPDSDTIDIAAAATELMAPRMPTHAWLTLSNYCNLKCLHCRRQYREHKPDDDERTIPDALYERMICEVLPFLQSIILGGNNSSEITSAARFPDFIDRLLTEPSFPKRISVQTNGSRIQDKILEKLVALNTVFNISVEGGTDATTRRIRGISLSSIGNWIGRINQVRMVQQSRARVVLSFTAMRSNIHELNDLLEFSELCGVDEVNVMYLLPATPAWNAESVIHDRDDANAVLTRAFHLSEAWRVQLLGPQIREMEDKPCAKPWYSVSINGNGSTRFCCLEDSPEIGNLNRDHFAQIWNGVCAKDVRRRVNSESPLQGCKACVLRNLPYVNARALRRQLA